MLGVVETEIPAGHSAPLHVHSREDEAFFVLAGAVDFICGERRVHGEAGAFVFLPRGVPHTFVGATAQSARVLVLFSPAGLECPFAEPQRFAEILRAHDVRVVDPPPRTPPPEIEHHASAARFAYVGPGAGVPVRRLNGEDTRLLVGGAQTTGAYAARVNSAPPRFNAVPVHIHHPAEEAFYVLDGALSVYADGGWTEVPPESFVLVPRGLPHAIANARDSIVRWLSVISPAKHAGWVEAEHELIITTEGEPSPDRIDEIHRRFGLALIAPPPEVPGTAGA